MSQCVPNWEIDDPLQPSAPAPPQASRTDYEVAELTWVNGHPSMHGLGHIHSKPNPKFPPPWEKGGGTLESVVDQATGVILLQSTPQPEYDLVPWFAVDQRNGGVCSSAATPEVTAAVRGAVMDALVPCSNQSLVIDEATRVPEPAGGRCKLPRDGNCSASGSASSMGMPMDTCGGDEVAFTTSTLPTDGSLETENASCGRPSLAADEFDSVSHSRNSKRDNEVLAEKKGEGVRSSVSTKRSRAADVHNQSERKRRDRINERMKTLQKMVPNSSKTDKASMLDEVIDYLKQMQAQVQMMSRMTTMANPMMMPMPMQQLQMAMMAQMAQMGMGLGMAMGVDMNPLIRPSQPQQSGMAPPLSGGSMLHPPSYLPHSFATNSLWDGDQRVMTHNATPPMPPVDPFSTFMACQPQMPMDVLNRMATTMFQQLYQQPPPQQNTNPNK